MTEAYFQSLLKLTNSKRQVFAATLACIVDLQDKLKLTVNLMHHDETKRGNIYQVDDDGVKDKELWKQGYKLENPGLMAVQVLLSQVVSAQFTNVTAFDFTFEPFTVLEDPMIAGSPDYNNFYWWKMNDYHAIMVEGLKNLPVNLQAIFFTAALIPLFTHAF